jgi:DNA-directed RNA polymerase subunit H (RpoH/RPB5)
MDQLYEKYLNIQKFITEYRKYTTKIKFSDFATFKKTMQMDQYILHKCVDTTLERDVFIYLFTGNSRFIKTTPQFKRIMDKTSDDPADVIIITKEPLSIYINKALVKYPHLNVFNYLHVHFNIELSKGPLCSKHTILSTNEVRTLCSQDLVIHPLSLPSISINDPQNIWIGGKLGQVIKIESISEITGKSIRYRIVAPESGKVMNMQKYDENTKKIKSDDADAEADEVDPDEAEVEGETHVITKKTNEVHEEYLESGEDDEDEDEESDTAE